MSKTTMSTFEFMTKFDTEESARRHFESRRWRNGKFCPKCKSTRKITERKGKRVGMYQCGDCRAEFSARTGTILANTKISYRKWFMAIYMVMVARKGVSSLQLAKELGITQKSAWFLLHRLREACAATGNDKLAGVIEVDETYIGGKERNKHNSKKLKAGRGAVGKQAVIGMRERGGKVKAHPINNTTINVTHQSIFNSVQSGSTLYTDDARHWTGGVMRYKHASVNHSTGEYVNGDAHTNSIESVWAVLKRGINGTFHHISTKHAERYVNEFAFRLNEGNVKGMLMDRIDSLLDGMLDKRLTYSRLTA